VDDRLVPPAHECLDADMNRIPGPSGLSERLTAYRPQLRYGVRATIVVLAAFWLGRVAGLPLNGLWAVLTAVVVTQMSAGGSVRASLEYMVGTLAGAIYAGLLGVAVPHTSMLALTALLVITIAPLAIAAAVNASFRAAPFSALLVLLIAGQLGEGPVGSALLRIGEVALGAVIAIVISFLVFPERARSLALDAAARILREMARILPQLAAGCFQALDRGHVRRVQDDLGAAIVGLQTITADAGNERLFRLAADPDQGPLSRTLLRMRHDLVIVGRAAATPLPAGAAQGLEPLLARLAASASEFMEGCATALVAGAPPPALGDLETALAAFTSALDALRRDGLPASPSAADVEQVFALGFAFEQLHRDFADLDRCVREHARKAHGCPRRD
jgi:uncharacterized membrane protein YccC